MTDICIDSYPGAEAPQAVAGSRSPLTTPTWDSLRPFVAPVAIGLWLVVSIVSTHHEAAAANSDAVMCKQPK